MPKLLALFRKLITSLKSASIIYPIVILLVIPALLVVNTIWNLKSFNRDVNNLIRHQASSIADAIKPVIVQNLKDGKSNSQVLQSLTASSKEIVSATLVVVKGNHFTILDTTGSAEQASASAQLGLNQIATGLNQSVAGLVYNPYLSQNIWNVVTPLGELGGNPYLLTINIKTTAADALLTRTSRDSYIILAALVIATLILLANHFILYKKALRAQQLAELDRLKDEFISLASHELRAPVTGLIGYLELMRDKFKNVDDKEIKQNLNILDNLSKNLRNLVNDLLDVSRIDQGRLELSPKPTNVNDVIKKVVEEMTPWANQRGLSITFNPVELPVVNTDPERLRQTLTNLISNSIKYTLKGSISVFVSQKDKNIEFIVKDTGIGIPPEKMEKLFTKFSRVKDEKTTGVTGTGLGLWITKQIVEQLGGKIYAESIYGTGSSFTFTLPAA